MKKSSEKQIFKTYHLDSDVFVVSFHLDDYSGKYLGEYPDFTECPRYTPNGRPWVSVIEEGCPYAEADDRTCGSCRYLQKAGANDLIGVCMNEKQRQQKRKTHGEI